jgi:hypothetical protein
VLVVAAPLTVLWHCVDDSRSRTTWAFIIQPVMR